MLETILFDYCTTEGVEENELTILSLTGSKYIF